jgi:hypothetical protein
MLSQLNTEPTKLPRKRLRLLLVNIYGTGSFVLGCNLIVAFSSFITWFPFYLGVCSATMTVACLPTVIFLSYDPAHITKPARPGTASSGSKGAQSTTHSSSSKKDSNKKEESEVREQKAPEATKSHEARGSIDRPAVRESGHMELV